MSGAVEENSKCFYGVEVLANFYLNCLEIRS